MDNYSISDALGLYAKLAELHNENPFKVKAYTTAAFNIKKIKDPLEAMSDEALDNVPGVGKSVIGAIHKIIKANNFPELQELIEKTPEGILAMLRIKGLGPKKVGLIWNNMGIDNVEDLFDACRENRLVQQSGFGLKTQNEIIRAIEFSWNANGKFHYARIEAPAKEVLLLLNKNLPEERSQFTGALRRCCEIIDEAEILTTATQVVVLRLMESAGMKFDDGIFKDLAGFKFKIIHCTHHEFDRKWFETTATTGHLQELWYNEKVPFTTEEEYYQSQGLNFIVPEMREGVGEVERAKLPPKGKLLEFSDLKGILHNHTDYSDGLNTLREMAEYCQEIGYEYLAICDHSKSAGYAHGLEVERVLQQHKEIDSLNKELAPFKVFKGIESDILGDGSLDYEPEILAQFDLVVASIHSNLKMDEAKAMERLTKAIENPFTHILGHPTGRLLLVRPGYPVNHKFIIDACAANGVSIELNANPFRLDLDWRWIHYAMEKGVVIGINPDAHEKHAYHDMYFGSLAARKGGLTREMTLNAKSLAEFETWLQIKKSRAVN